VRRNRREGIEPCQSQHPNEVRVTVWLRFDSRTAHFFVVSIGHKHYLITTQQLC